MTTLLQAATKEIALQTRCGTDIDNGQSTSYSTTERKDFEKLDSRYGARTAVTFRTGPSFVYNCHGMTFASRRTMVNMPSEVRKILTEDDYEQVPDKNVEPGDVVVYIQENGDIEHSAVVIQKPDNNLSVPRVISKWGKYREVIHWANDCPYRWDRIEYFRVTK